jgi:hypothetical protein
MTPAEREEAGLKHVPKETPGRRPDAPRSGNIKKLIAADAILGGGIAANRALSQDEDTPPLPPPPVRLIPNVPVPAEEKSDTLAMNVSVREERGRPYWGTR